MSEGPFRIGNITVITPVHSKTRITTEDGRTGDGALRTRNFEWDHDGVTIEVKHLRIFIPIQNIAYIDEYGTDKSQQKGRRSHSPPAPPEPEVKEDPKDVAGAIALAEEATNRANEAQQARYEAEARADRLQRALDDVRAANTGGTPPPPPPIPSTVAGPSPVTQATPSGRGPQSVPNQNNRR